jgi:methyltransferase (TIGR00027 family)
MRPKQCSRTTYEVGVLRAAHQIVEGGKIFHDPFARLILGDDADAAIARTCAPGHLRVRLFVAARSRFADDYLAAGFARGVRQVVILGAGLDTFALRNPYANLSVFEVDHPATQEWKRECLTGANISFPPGLYFAPVDFEQQTLADGLRAAGFDAGRSAFFIWLGVIPYLTNSAIDATLDFIAKVPRAEVVLDYSEPLENYSPNLRALMEAMASRVATIGEPWLSHFDPTAMAELLRCKGFDEIKDLGLAAISKRYYGGPPNTVPVAPGPHVLHARRIKQSPIPLAPNKRR